MFLLLKLGYAAVHLAAKNGHTNVIDGLKSSNSSAIAETSKKLGLTALHIAAFYGQAGMHKKKERKKKESAEYKKFGFNLNTQAQLFTG